MERSTRWKIRILVWLVVTGGVVALLMHYVGLGDQLPWRFTYESKQWELAEPAMPSIENTKAMAKKTGGAR